jgi:hypothetical protein
MLENKEKTKVKMYAIETNLPSVKRELSNAELDLIYIKTLNLDSMDEEEKKLFRESVFASLLVNIDKREEEKIEEYIFSKTTGEIYLEKIDWILINVGI